MEGRGADILISAPDLVVQNFSTINTLSFAAGESGSIGVQTQNLLIDGDNPLSFFLPNSIGSVSSGSGGTGKILVTGEKISLLNGGLLISQNIGRGEGRPVRISADLIEISGAVPLEPSATQFVPSSVGSTTVFSETSSDVFISSDQLRLDSGGGLFANTNASGNAGDLVIKANSIEIKGGVPSPIEEFSLPSQISSSADQPSPIFRELFALPSIPSGNAGSVELKTKNLTISDGALVSVLNEGTGNAGSIKINAENIHLDGGNISATTVSGQGGNINLEAQDLSLINNSTISATADGVGNGGNILINSDSLLLQGSTIKADALEGNGGNILINTEVFLVSSDSEITATSELGVDGTVEINTPERNLESIIKPVRATIIDVNLNLLQLCVNEKGEEALVLVKSEGLPELPLAEKATEYHDPELPQFIEVSKYLSPEEREFYQERLSGNAIIQTEDGEIKYVNLCLRDLMAEQEKLRFEEKQKSQNNR